MRKSGMAPVYVGDVGVIVEPSLKYSIPDWLDLSKLDLRQICNLAASCGISIRDILGIDHCWEHQDKIAIGGRELPQGFNLFEHCVICRSCGITFRLAELPK